MRPRKQPRTRRGPHQPAEPLVAEDFEEEGEAPAAPVLLADPPLRPRAVLEFQAHLTRPALPPVVAGMAASPADFRP